MIVQSCKLVYYCNLQIANTPIITLGYFYAAKLDKADMLALVTIEPSEKELEEVGSLAKELISDPYFYFSKSILNLIQEKDRDYFYEFTKKYGNYSSSLQAVDKKSEVCHSDDILENVTHINNGRFSLFVPRFSNEVFDE